MYRITIKGLFIKAAAVVACGFLIGLLYVWQLARRPRGPSLAYGL
jgi:hypothetical protein